MVGPCYRTERLLDGITDYSLEVFLGTTAALVVTTLVSLWGIGLLLRRGCVLAVLLPGLVWVIAVIRTTVPVSVRLMIPERFCWLAGIVIRLPSGQAVPQILWVQRLWCSALVARRTRVSSVAVRREAVI